MTDEIKLKPCPFCGCKADFKIISSFSRLYVTVHCDGCKAEVDNIEESTDYCAKQVAADKWNRRVNND